MLDSDRLLSESKHTPTIGCLTGMPWQSSCTYIVQPNIVVHVFRRLSPVLVTRGAIPDVVDAGDLAFRIPQLDVLI